MVTGRTSSHLTQRNSRMPALRWACLLLMLISGCKWPSLGLQSKVQDESVASQARDAAETKPDPRRSGEDGHSDPAVGPAATASSTLPKKKNGKPELDIAQISIDKLLQRGYGAAKKGNVDEAKKSYLEVLRRQPDQAVAHHRLAIIADSQGDFRTADFHYQSALRSNASDPDLLNDMGYSYLMQGDYKQSQQFLTEAVNLKADHKQALNNLALLHSLQGDYDAAAEVLRRANSEEEAQAKLAKLFPNGRPVTQTSMEVPEPVMTVEPSALRAPDLRGATPPASAEGGRVAANTGIATSVPSAETQVPTARFTGEVTAAAPVVAADRVVDQGNAGMTQDHQPAMYVTESEPAKTPNGMNRATIPNQSVPVKTPGLTDWNRLPVTFGASTETIGTSNEALISNSPVSVANADYVAGRPAATASLPPRITEYQRTALLMGMNAGPGSLFPIIVDRKLPEVQTSNESEVAPAFNATNVPKSSLGPLEERTTDVTPAVQPEPQFRPSEPNASAPVNIPIRPYGAPQYPSMRHTESTYPGSLPRTEAPPQSQPTTRIGSFQAMP